MYLTTHQWKQIAQDLLEVGLNAISIKKEHGVEGVVDAWLDLGDEEWHFS